MTTIHFVRHGHVYNPEGILYGRLPNFRLSDEGVKQANAAADYLSQRPISAVYSSPQLRARQTASIIAERHAPMLIHISEYINELLTDYQGYPIKELEAIDWEFYENVTPPNESPLDLIIRIKKFAQVVRTAYPQQEVIAVTHGDIVVFSMAWAENVSIDGEFKKRVSFERGYPATASITSLYFANDAQDVIPTMTYTVPYTVASD